MKRRSKPLYATTLLLSFLATILLFQFTAQRGIAGSQPALRVIANKNLIEESGEDINPWHDYGSFALYRIPPEAWQKMPDEVRSQAQLLNNAQKLFVGDTVINTQQDILRQADSAEATRGEALQLIQFVGPIKDEWLLAIEATGAELVQYIANYGYLVWADSNSRQQLDMMARQDTFMQFSMPYKPALRLGPTLSVDRNTTDSGNNFVSVTIQVYRHDQVNLTKQAIEAMLVEVHSPWEAVLNFQNIKGIVREQDLPTIAAFPAVVWVGESFDRELNDEVQGQIMANYLVPNKSAPVGPGYLSWLAELGLSSDPSSFPIVDIIDDGIGNGIAATAGDDVTLREQGLAEKPSRLAYIANCTSAANGASPDGHGHLNVSIAGGFDIRSGFPYQDQQGYQLGLGVNPFGRFAGTRVFDDNRFTTEGCGGTDSSLISETYNRGARIISNSWGCGQCAGTYDAGSQAYDAAVRDADPNAEGNQELLILFSAGNYGPKSASIGTPGNGKNVLTVGASENVRPTWTDGCGIVPSQADSVLDIASFSSRGPAPGGRTKPDVVAPGTHIQGTASTDPNYPPDGTNLGVCDIFHPNGQAIFNASSGTSHAVPAVAGFASLAYAFLQQNYGLASPSPALLKAFIVAHTLYLDGFDSGDDLPSHNQGFGLPDMSSALKDTERVIIDQTEAKLFDESGEKWTLTLAASDPKSPIRIVMAYTDQPGAIGSEPHVNDLNLTVRADGITYFGNQFSRQWSMSGGTPDGVNNVEAVFLPSISDPIFEIEVTAFNIAGDGVPGVGDGSDQDFTLVCSNCVVKNEFTLSAKPIANSLCRPESAEYALHLESMFGFAEAVSMNIIDLPAGMSSQFSSNPVRPTATTMLTLTADETVPAGSYAIDVAGRTTDNEKSITLLLDVNSQEPGFPKLLYPLNEGNNLPVDLQLSWAEAAQAGTYEVQIANDPNFDQIVEEAVGLVQTTYTASKLQPDHVYFWRVRTVNSCATGKYTASATFRTSSQFGGCHAGVAPEIIYFSDFEGSAPGWIHEGIQDSWRLTEERTHSASTAFYAANFNGISDQRLVSPPIDLPAIQGALTLQFWNYQSLESNESGDQSCFDGAILEISANQGQSWQQVGGPPQTDNVLITDPYDGIISSRHENPISGKAAWCGDPQDWTNSVVRVDEYAGKTVRFRFRLGSDLSIGTESGHEGWYIDDVRVQVCPSLNNNTYLPAILTHGN